MIFNWLSGFVVYQHHNHPRLQWYASRADWDFVKGQVDSTVHVRFPWPIGLLFHNIMEHTAHHVDPRIPLYQLEAAQRGVEDAYGEHVIIVDRWWPSLRAALRDCQLYDYSHQRWCRFRDAQIDRLVI